MKDERMKNEKDIELHDAFSKHIRQKLANHTMPVDDDVWKGIQQKITPQKRIIPWWAFAAATAAAVALLFTIGNFIQHQHQKDIAQEVTPVTKTIVQEGQKEITPSVKEDLLAVDDIAFSTEKSTKRITTEEVPAVETIDPVIVATLTTKKEIELIAPSINTEEVAPAAVAGKNTAPTTILKEKLQELEADWTDIIKKKEDRQTMLAANVGYGIGSSSATITRRSRAYRHESLVDMNTTYNSVLTPNDFTTKHYLPPVTVGVSVRMPLNTRFSLESGLLYTYLTTKLSGNTNAAITAETNLHYLGLPLNLIITLFNEKRWEIYVSTGGTLEKGLRSEFRQYQDYGNTLFATRGNTSIDGLQWSINASLGVAYHLNHYLSLYLDPKLSYYFENDQPFSIRSDMPLLVGLNTGLRMTL